jgi:hypothetical protein
MYVRNYLFVIVKSVINTIKILKNVDVPVENVIAVMNVWSNNK